MRGIYPVRYTEPVNELSRAVVKGVVKWQPFIDRALFVPSFTGSVYAYETAIPRNNGGAVIVVELLVFTCTA